MVVKIAIFSKVAKKHLNDIKNDRKWRQNLKIRSKYGAVVHNGFECYSVYQGNSFSDMALLILIPFFLNNGKTSCSVNWIEVKPSKSREVLSSNKITYDARSILSS